MWQILVSLLECKCARKAWLRSQHEACPVGLVDFGIDGFRIDGSEGLGIDGFCI